MKKVAALIIAISLLIGMTGIVISDAAVKYDSIDDYGEPTNSTLAIIKGDGADLYAADGWFQQPTQDYLVLNANTIHGPFAALTLKGFFAANADISIFGYAVGENDPVFSEDFFSDMPESALAGGLNYARGYEITIDVSALGEEKTLIKPVVKLEDGTVIEATYLTIYYTTKAAEAEVKPEIIELTEGAGGPAYNFNGNKSVAFRFNVPEGKRLDHFTVIDSPTWNGPATGVGCTAQIYRWIKDDFDESIETEPLGEYIEEDHKDNANLDISFEEIIPAGDYLIVLTDFTGNIGGWGPQGVKADQEGKFMFFVNGEEVYPPSVKCKMTVIEYKEPEPTEAPQATEAPTDVPPTEAAPTQAPATDVPATDAPVATEAATKAPEGGNDSKGPNTGLIAGVIAGVVVLAAVVAGVVIARKRKK